MILFQSRLCSAPALSATAIASSCASSSLMRLALSSYSIRSDGEKPPINLVLPRQNLLIPLLHTNCSRHAERDTLAKKKRASQIHRVKNALPNSSPPELFNDTIDSRLKVVNGTGVLSPGTNEATRIQATSCCVLFWSLEGRGFNGRVA